MVSFHSPTRRKVIPELEDATKKRKWEETQADQEISEKPLKAKNMKSIFDTELHHENPLPLDWQRCLDIKTGQIYYYNTRTQKRTSSDPRISAELPNHGHMSLDLELNLLCGSVGKNHVGDSLTKHNSGESLNNATAATAAAAAGNQFVKFSSSEEKKNMGGLRRCPSWLAFEGDHREMVTAVCKKCHMLVMMCKSSPACPNCKFMHPPDQSPPTLFDQGKVKSLMLIN